jgi:hypothetical protein
MDLNKLYSRHQLALMHAGCADDCKERERHQQEADAIASRISKFQDRVGADSIELLPADAY